MGVHVLDAVIRDWLGPPPLSLEGPEETSPTQKNSMKNSQNMPVWLRELDLAEHNCTVWGDWRKVHLQKRL